MASLLSARSKYCQRSILKYGEKLKKYMRFLHEFLEFLQITFGWYVVFSSTYHPKVIWGNSENSRRNHVFSSFPHTSRWGVDSTCSWPIGATPWSAKASISSQPKSHPTQPAEKPRILPPSPRNFFGSGESAIFADSPIENDHAPKTQAFST